MDAAERLADPPACEPVLAVEALVYAWPGGETLIDLPELTLAPRERLFIEGPSGSGKSTLLSLIAGVIRPDHGRLRLLGQDVTDLPSARRDRFRADHIGLIFQQFNLIPYLDAVDNVLLACRFSPRRRQRCGDPRTEALRLLAHMGIDTPKLLARPAARLSIGQQQRVAAARALIGSPELVIADEPTSALDPPLRERFLALLFAECAAAGSALLFVSHDPQLAAAFPRRLRLGAA